jgi:multidrug efflux pump subunit AcrB
VEGDASRETLIIDRARAARLGVSQAAIVETLQVGVTGVDATWVQTGRSRYPHAVRLRLAPADQARMDDVLALRVRAAGGKLVPLAELVTVQRGDWDAVVHHKDLLPVVYVTGDEAGWSDSPLRDVQPVSQLRSHDVAGSRLAQYSCGSRKTRRSSR